MGIAVSYWNNILYDLHSFVSMVTTQAAYVLHFHNSVKKINISLPLHWNKFEQKHVASNDMFVQSVNVLAYFHKLWYKHMNENVDHDTLSFSAVMQNDKWLKMLIAWVHDGRSEIYVLTQFGTIIFSQNEYVKYFYHYYRRETQSDHLHNDKSSMVSTWCLGFWLLIFNPWIVNHANSVLGTSSSDLP